MQTFWSKRGIMLTYHLRDGGLPQDRPVLTVENYCKWYYLHLVHPDGHVTEVGYDEVEQHTAESEGSAYVDHVPNPAGVERLCEARCWVLHEQSHEMMIGRWQLEVRDLLPGGRR